MQFATERQRTTGILPKQYVCHFELVIVTFHAASMTGQWMHSSERQNETGGGDRSNPIVGTVARLAAVIAAHRHLTVCRVSTECNNAEEDCK